jgi:hypothetical protein
MTDSEQQELFARLEKLERSAWRWRVFASMLAVFFLLLLPLGLVSAVALRNQAVMRERLAAEQDLEAERRARAAAEEAERLPYLERVQAARREAEQAPAAPRRMPRAQGP